MKQDSGILNNGPLGDEPPEHERDNIVEDALLRTFEESPQLLEGATPSRDLWAGIESRIETRVLPIEGRTASTGAAPRKWMTRWASMSVAAAALIAVTATVTYVMTERRHATVGVSIASNPRAPLPSSASAPVSGAGIQQSPMGHDSFNTPTYARTAMGEPSHGVPAVNAVNSSGGVEQAYDRDIAALKAILDSRRGQLDPATTATIERNLRIIDEAIRQSREALAKDPNSRLLSGQLNRVMERKVKLLRTAVMLPRSA